MTTKNETDQPEPTQAQKRAYCRQAVALYLRELADMIASGAVDGFALQWDTEAETLKPMGRVAFDAMYLNTTLPHHQAQAQARSRSVNLSAVRAPIPVEDLSENLKDLKPCEDSECPNCGKKS